MFGFINLSKPSGWTSREAVNLLQRLLKPLKVGHAGTLDPLATGVLPIAVGQATRLVEYLQQQSKTYVATFLLGRESDTEDITGETHELLDAPQPELVRLNSVLPQFLGEIEQVPPAYSALKVQGKRAYERARQGENVVMTARKIDVFQLQILSYAYPELQLSITCGSGTYVRSLGRDLARAVGTAALMSALVRSSVGSFQLAESVSPEQLTIDNIASYLQPAARAVSHLPRIDLSPSEVIELSHGRKIASELPPCECVAGFHGSGELFALLEGRGRYLHPFRVSSGSAE